MREIVIFDQDGRSIVMEATAEQIPQTTGAPIGPARSVGEHATQIVGQSFEAAVAMVGSLADGFAKALEGRRVKEAEITLGLKATVKGDFVIVGSTGEATLTLKIKIS